MYVETVPNRNSPPAILLREGWREGKRVRKRTIANLTNWPQDKIDRLRLVLKNVPLVHPDELFVVEHSLPHGHIEIVLLALSRLRLPALIDPKPSRQRNLVLALIVQSLLQPASKLATTRLWHTTTLASELSLDDADEDDLYGAMDWLLQRQGRIEKKLARRHLAEGDHVLYDLSTRYYEGHTSSPVQYGHSRDGKRGRPIIVYGVMADAAGCPVAVQAYPGNTGDPVTVPDQVETLRRRFGLKRVVLVGDRDRCLKTVDLRVRPIRHRTETRIRSHLFLCLLSYYVEWHLRRALAPLLFDDEDPVLAAQPSESAKRKKPKLRTEEGLPIQSFATLMAELGTRARYRCRTASDPDGPKLQRLAEPTPLQRRALQLVNVFPVTNKAAS
jgi:hypothetical protein